MYMKPIVESDILKIVSKFNVNKSAGHDNIGNFIIKKGQSEIVEPLTSILTYLCQQVLFQINLVSVFGVIVKLALVRQPFLTPSTIMAFVLALPLT